MLRLIKTTASILVYLLGSIVFVFVGYQVFELIGFSRHVSLLASVPIGIIAFAIFIWWHWDEDFKSWYDADHVMKEDEKLSALSLLWILAGVGFFIAVWFLPKLILR
jgi:positive regulator of sigma E activity